MICPQYSFKRNDPEVIMHDHNKTTLLDGSVEQDEGIELAKKIVEEEEGLGRQPAGFARLVIPTLAVAWSLFQLSIASFWILDSTLVRAIHLGFALSIIFLNYPMLKKKRFGLDFLSTKARIPIFDYCLAALAGFAALYIVIDHSGMVERVGMPILRDLVIGMLLLVLLLEGARRVLGPAMPTIAAIFVLYAFFGPYMPDFIAFKGVSLNRFVGQMTMSTEGIYGVPLNVSATIVFLFVLFGAMLDKAGGGRYFIQLALSLLGGYRGGPAKAAVLGSCMTGMVSGSSVANVVTCGTFTIPMMKKVGYPPTKAAAIEVASGVNGQIMPPVMGAAAFIIAEYVNVPYSEVCKAAVVPAIAIYVALFYITHLEACKLGLKGIPRNELPNFFKTLAGGFHFLVPLAVLLYELIIARHSPDMAAFKAIVTIAAVMLLQHPVRAYLRKEPLAPAFKQGVVDIFQGLAAGGRNMLTVACACAAAGIIVGIVAMGLGQLITSIVATLSMGNVYLLLIIAALCSLMLGMGLPTTANYIVVASLMVPVILEVGQMNGFVVPLMAAHLYCFYFGILADDTPPVCLAAYAAAAIAKAPPLATGIQGFMYDIRTAVLPLMFIFNSDLILHNINSWPQALLILVMTCLACCAFSIAAQGWFIIRNRFYEAPLFLLTALILFRPELLTRLIGIPEELRYTGYAFGVALFAMLYGMQRLRRSATEDAVMATA
jgi:TRAP transporter 4TM/12TM fusion protein